MYVCVCIWKESGTEREPGGREGGVRGMEGGWEEGRDTGFIGQGAGTEEPTRQRRARLDPQGHPSGIH